MDVTLQRTSKTKITRSTSFMADDKETVNHAAGDIIGLYDTGNYQIGDTLVGASKNIVSKIYLIHTGNIYESFS